MKNKIVFICEANLIIGLGHLNRINNLAKLFYSKGYECFIFGVKKKYILNNYYKKIFSKNILTKSDINLTYLNNHLKSKNYFLIIDHLEINVKIQKKIFKNKIKWLQFDNLNKNNNKFFANIVVNANPKVTKKHYLKKLFNKKNQSLLLGKKYLVVRDEFKTKYYSQRQYVLICSGGGTSDNGFLFFVTGFLLKNFSNLKIIVVLKKKDPREKKIVNLEKNSNKLKIVRDTKNISRLLSKSKIAIISGGTILLESLFFNLHRLVISISNNQEKNSLAWNKLSYVSYLGSIKQRKIILKQKIYKKFTHFYNKNKTKKLSQSLTNGKEKIVKKIIKIL